MEDWSLQAIVKGSSGDYAKSVDLLDMSCENNHSFSATQYGNQEFDHELLLASFPEIFEALSGSGDELEDLYKPFYPAAPLHSADPPAQTVLHFQEQDSTLGAEDHKLPHDQVADQTSGNAVVAAYTPKYKKRKNQHKRVVIQVSAEGVSSDMWAWRKYGQKPIKGSPYPRSYYRCSSSKGCLARKQVEQSCSDPGMFIITYTAEHSHSQPTRRNSLAGTVRQKFPALKNSKSATTDHVKRERSEELMVSPSAQAVEFLHQPAIKEENGDGNDVNMSEFVFHDDFFSGLDELDGFIGELAVVSQYASAAQQLPVRSCS